MTDVDGVFGIDTRAAEREGRVGRGNLVPPAEEGVELEPRIGLGVVALSVRELSALEPPL